jgi:hypothetical protein
MMVNANFVKEKNGNRWFIDFESESRYPGNESDFNALAKLLSMPRAAQSRHECRTRKSVRFLEHRGQNSARCKRGPPSHSATQPLSHSAIQPFSHSATQPPSQNGSLEKQIEKWIRR